ncbi:MAG: HAD hydrolase family protein [Candidatus Andersenbacteria bacterium]
MKRLPTSPITRVMFDVDGVFTTGQFLYTSEGKFAKIFGPHDADGVKMLRRYVTLEAISADKRGWNITKKRMDDMELPVTLVSELERHAYFSQLGDLDSMVYMGDGIYDARVFEIVAYSIAPANAHPLALQAADYVTQAQSAEGAVAEACFYIKDLFFARELREEPTVQVNS